MAEAERRYRILIVDDDDIDARNYGRLLRRKAADEIDLQRAADGMTALALLQSATFDCVLLDFCLPDMTGLDFLAEASAAGPPAFAVVLMTGQGSETIAVNALQQGAQDYLVKDCINTDSLWRAMTRAVMQMELRQRLAASHRALEAMNDSLRHEAVIRCAAEAGLRAAKLSADEANAAKTRFIAMVTHDLRTPLNGILGYAQLLQMEGGLSPHQLGRVSAMMQAGQHLLGMIEQVLDVASIETGHMILTPEPLRLSALAQGCMAVIRPLASEQGLALRLVHPKDAPQDIIADPTRLQQVLLNLLGNAVKFTEAGTVELRFLAAAAPGGLRIEVADTGPGISADKLGLLFQDFERIGAAPSVEGAGLGLSIAARITTAMGGVLGHAANPGGGSVFWIDLPTGVTAPLYPEVAAWRGMPATDAVAPNFPAAEAQLLAAAPHPSATGRAAFAGRPNFPVAEAPYASGAPPQSPAAPGQPEAVEAAPAPPAAPSGKRILLVDDIAMNRDVIGAFLRAGGHQPVLAASGEDALRINRAGGIDMILMDIQMPVMDGLEATRRIRALPGTCGEIPILALTAYSSQARAAQCIAAGMDGCISKPVDCAGLLREIASVLYPPRPPNRPPSLRFERAIFDATVACLPAGDVGGHLGNLEARIQDVVGLLVDPTASIRLQDAAHGLASHAGMFGLTALSDASRQLEGSARGPGTMSRRLGREAAAALAMLPRMTMDSRIGLR